MRNKESPSSKEDNTIDRIMRAVQTHAWWYERAISVNTRGAHEQHRLHEQNVETMLRAALQTSTT